MLMNNLKSFLIHILISASAYYYTDNVSLKQSGNIYLIILLSSLLLYFLAGRLFLDDRLTPSKNMLSVSFVPLFGMIIWTVLFRQLKNSVFSIDDWETYLIYVGYTTPLLYKYIGSFIILPIFTWIPAVIMYSGIKCR